ncbi:MAG TPA: hypothetical protein VG826_25915 [Pirellulales bacterium]|nr:hypothetical protein [Pirellulales bacterium]
MKPSTAFSMMIVSAMLPLDGFRHVTASENGASALEPAGDDIAQDIARIAHAGPLATGSREARQARDRLSRHGADVLPRLLGAMDTTNVVAANWYRTVYEEIVTRELSRPEPKFPLEDLRTFAGDPRKQGRVRRLVVNLLDRLQPGFAAGFVPTLLDDPEFRADAVDAALAAGAKAEASGDRLPAIAQFRNAFEHARSADQVSQAAAKLTAMGEKADIATHLGLVTDWYLLGPFDAPEYTGFAMVFPPETRIDLKATYGGKDGATIRWARHRGTDALGQLNLIQAIAPVKEAVGYAYSELIAPRNIDVQLRCGADDNCTVWLNGQQAFGREQWLNGTRFDRFVVPVRLRSGKNTLLVKVCQGPQHKDPEVPNNWSLQLRFCDETGVGVGLVSALPEAKETSE